MKPEPPTNDKEVEAEQYGLDLDLLERTLQMTPDERVRAHDRAVAMAKDLREAVRKSQLQNPPVNGVWYESPKENDGELCSPKAENLRFCNCLAR